MSCARPSRVSRRADDKPTTILQISSRATDRGACDRPSFAGAMTVFVASSDAR
jgi:hypothetical protein